MLAVGRGRPCVFGGQLLCCLTRLNVLSSVSQGTSMPLSDLIVNEQQISEDALRDALAPHIALTQDGRVMFKPGPPSTARRRTILALLAMWAAARLGLRASDSLTPREIESITGIKGPTLRPLLRKLAKDALVESERAEYRVPTYAFHAAIEEVRNG